jgi:cation transport regulator ChaC
MVVDHLREDSDRVRLSCPRGGPARRQQHDLVLYGHYQCCCAATSRGVPTSLLRALQYLITADRCMVRLPARLCVTPGAAVHPRTDLWSLLGPFSYCRMVTQAEARQVMDSKVRELYDYETVVAKAPAPEAVEWVFGYGSILFKQGFSAGECVAGYIKGWRRAFHQHSTDHRGTPDAPGRTVTLLPDADAHTWGIAYKLPADLGERRSALEARPANFSADVVRLNKPIACSNRLGDRAQPPYMAECVYAPVPLTKRINGLLQLMRHSAEHAIQELEWREKQYDMKVFAAIHSADGATVVPRALVYVGSSDPDKNLNWGGDAPMPELAKQIAAAAGPSGQNYEYLYNLADGLRDIGADDSHVFDLEERVRAIRGDAPPPSAPR